MKKAKRYGFSALFLVFACAAGFCEGAAYKSIGFPGMERQEVAVYRKRYLTTHKKWLYTILDENESYRVFVRKELEKRKLPLILEYLPIVESNYLPTARSRSGAAGMWQFMLNSTKPYLVCNEYVDERLDPWKSTEAALSKLKENYDMFGDWLIAITAYNTGAGGMRRALGKSSKKDYWSLCDANLLSEQARQYVPKLLALADVAENAAYYKVNFPTARDGRGNTLDAGYGTFDYLPVTQSFSIEALARELRIDEDILAGLNAALVKGVTPPNAEYAIRLPRGMLLPAAYTVYWLGKR